MVILIVYVDDNILTGDDLEELARLKGFLAQEFEIKDLGQLWYFLGMEVVRTKKGDFYIPKEIHNWLIEGNKHAWLQTIWDTYRMVWQAKNEGK